MPFLFKDLAERSVLQNLDFVLVFISGVRYISNLPKSDLLWANLVLELGLLCVSLALYFLSN